MKIINKLIIPIIITILLLCASNSQWGKDGWKNIIKVDGKGYYAYLPALFIYQDLNFSFFDSIEKKYPNPHIYYDYRVGEENKKVNKYFAGTALAMMPFFVTAHVAAEKCGFETDGYSKIYLVAISIAAIFYLMIGLYFLKKLLLRLDTSATLTSFILIVVTFATNIFYYALCEPAMSHLYSFAFITMFVYFLAIFFSFPKALTVYIIAALYGIIILIRPVNGMIVLIAPFMANDKIKFKEGLYYLKNNFFTGVIGLFITISIVSIQLIIYKIQTGNFWINSYGTEQFNWTNPHPIDFLISYKKGLFVYTPLACIALLGFYKLFKQNKFQFYSLFIFLIVMLYVLSSWWSWWYGGSFSSRVCIEYYFILALLLSVAYQMLQSRWSKNLYTSVIICLLLICQIQTYQYRYYIIHWDKMDKEHYWRVFLRVDQLGKENPNADLLK
jgi:hypothetical protein